MPAITKRDRPIHLEFVSNKSASPLGGLPYGQVTFYWNAAPGATSYRVNLYNGDSVMTSINSNGATTNAQGDASGLGDGSSFGWNVQALVNGEVACTSGKVTMFREAAPAPTNVVLTPVCGNPFICEPGESYPTCFECG